MRPRTGRRVEGGLHRGGRGPPLGQNHPGWRREIGAELYLSVNTVKGYTKSLYRKLGVVSRAEAVHRGHELGLI